MKRCIDIVFAITLLIVLAPIMLCVAVIVRAKLGGPILFKQSRPGLHGQTFTLYKFRTMSNAANEQGELLADHARMTNLGRFLRKYSLDELPQLINVLKGELSLVGPRPLLVEYLPLYTEEQALRHQVKPGMTGWAQVNGRNALDWEQKFTLDIWYVNHQSLWLDCKILWLTLKKVIRPEGISNEQHATMPLFKGSVRQ